MPCKKITRQEYLALPEGTAGYDGKPDGSPPDFCGCCPNAYWCDQTLGNYEATCKTCAVDSPEYMPCEMADLMSCSGVGSTFPTEAYCVSQCEIPPPCCGSSEICTQQIQYFPTEAAAIAFCASVQSIPGTIEFGEGGYCKIRRYSDFDGPIGYQAAFCFA